MSKKKIKAYKAFEEDFSCRGFKYDVGKTYQHEGEVEMCGAGFHACESPLDVWNYYPPGNGRRYAEVLLSGDVESSDDKVVGRSIEIVKELTQAEMIDLARGFIAQDSKDSNSASSGYSSTAASSGNYSKAASSGYSSTAASSGYSSTAASSGNYSTAASSGYSSTAASSGNYSKAASSGYYSTAASSGYYSTAASSGDFSKAEAQGERTIAMVAGLRGRVRAGDSGCFALAYYDEESKRNRIKVGYVGEDGIKADTWYCVEGGELKEVGGE